MNVERVPTASLHEDPAILNIVRLTIGLVALGFSLVALINATRVKRALDEIERRRP